MRIGTLAAIWRYPVKSLRPEPLEEAGVNADGVDGDRTSALFVVEGHARRDRTFRGKEADRLHLAGDAASAVTMAAERGIEVATREGERFFDDAPISLIMDCWLRELSAAIGYDVEIERFRPNFFVRTEGGWAGRETALEGATLDLGAVRLRVRSPIVRGIVTTYDPNGGPSDPRVLRIVAQQRDTFMGVYCDVVTPGTVRAGDALVLLAST